VPPRVRCRSSAFFHPTVRCAARPVSQGAPTTSRVQPRRVLRWFGVRPCGSPQSEASGTRQGSSHCLPTKRGSRRPTARRTPAGTSKCLHTRKPADTAYPQVKWMDANAGKPANNRKRTGRSSRSTSTCHPSVSPTRQHPGWVLGVVTGVRHG